MIVLIELEVSVDNNKLQHLLKLFFETSIYYLMVRATLYDSSLRAVLTYRSERTVFRFCFCVNFYLHNFKWYLLNIFAHRFYWKSY